MRSGLSWMLAGTVVLSAVALLWPEPAPPSIVVDAREAESAEPARASGGRQAMVLPEALPVFRPGPSDSFDPFVGAEVVRKPPPPPVVAAPVAAPPPPPPAPPAPPPMSYRFLGRMSDPGGVQRVYLVNAEQVVDVAVGTRLDSGYVVRAIDETGVKLHYAPLDVHAVIPIPAAPEAGNR